MEKISLAPDLTCSRLVHGYWRLADWNLSKEATLDLVKKTVDLGVTTLDHADIYGDYTCEKLFGDALGGESSLRDKIQLVTKCGIKLLSSKYPERKIKTYDYSFQHILSSVDNSLKYLGTDYIDLLLLHRPAPFFDPAEVAEAFSFLKSQGKVLHFGVSNFTPLQFEMLNSALDFPLVTNQVEISPYCLEHFKNENIDFFLKEKINPMAWSPLGGGKLFSPSDEKGNRLHKVLTELAEELGTNGIDEVIYAWILNHPAKILPIVGSGKVERIKSAVNALDIKMTQEQWYKVYIASTGSNVP